MSFARTVRRWTVTHPWDDRTEAMLVRRLDAHTPSTRAGAHLCPGFAVRATGTQDTTTVELDRIPAPMAVTELDLEWACDYVAQTLVELTGLPTDRGEPVPA